MYADLRAFRCSFPHEGGAFPSEHVAEEDMRPKVVAFQIGMNMVNL